MVEFDKKSYWHKSKLEKHNQKVWLRRLNSTKRNTTQHSKAQRSKRRHKYKNLLVNFREQKSNGKIFMYFRLWNTNVNKNAKTNANDRYLIQ